MSRLLRPGNNTAPADTPPRSTAEHPQMTAKEAYSLDNTLPLARQELPRNTGPKPCPHTTVPTPPSTPRGHPGSEFGAYYSHAHLQDTFNGVYVLINSVYVLIHSVFVLMHSVYVLMNCVYVLNSVCIDGLCVGIDELCVCIDGPY